MPSLAELNAAMATIESFAPAFDKPMRIGVRLVPIYVIPVTYVENEQLIEVRVT